MTEKEKKPPKPTIDHVLLAAKLDGIDDLAGHVMTVLLKTLPHSCRATTFCRSITERVKVVREELDIRRRRDTGVWENSPYRGSETAPGRFYCHAVSVT